MTKICVPVSGRNSKSAREIADRALSSGADLIEIRADLIAEPDIDSIEEDFAEIFDRSIITLRSKAEGGASILSEKERHDWLRRATSLHPAFIDLELDADRKLISDLKDKKNVIVSRHINGQWTSDSVLKILSECCGLGGIGKVAVKVENADQSVNLLSKIAETETLNHAFMTMGPGSEISRALAPSLDSRLVYCSLDEKEKVAPGQLELKTQRRIAPDGRIIVGLLGHPLGHTMSPSMQNAAFEANDLPGVYLTFDIPDPSMIPDFIRKAAKLGVKGFNVTIPYKEIAFSAMDSVDNDARRARAVNTIVTEENGALKGYNTDIFGFSESLRVSGCNPRNKRALIVGAGGASRAAIIGLWKMGAKIVIANRTPERAEELVRSMRVFIKTMPLDALDKEEPFSLIINATPVGMSGFGSTNIIPDKLISSADTVMDMVYNPLETPLIIEARKHGIKAINGLDMLLYQGANAFEIWTGKKAPIDVMRGKLLEAIKK